jgi:hypothetical protein
MVRAGDCCGIWSWIYCECGNYALQLGCFTLRRREAGEPKS